MSAGGIRNQQGSGIRVEMDQSRTRQTPNTSFGNVMKTGLSKSADAVMNAGRLAAPFIPGGAVVSAAITGMGQLKSSSGAQGAGGGANASGVTITGTTGQSMGSGSVGGNDAFSAVAANAAGGDSQAQLMMATRQMQEMNMSFNLQYLMLQQKMQGDNRQFTLMSNIMKTKHDTAKNAINNVR